MFNFWKRPSNPKSGPGDQEVGLVAAGDSDDDDVAVPHLGTGGSVPEAEDHSGDLEAGHGTTDLPSSWRRVRAGTMVGVFQSLLFYQVIDMLRRLSRKMTVENDPSAVSELSTCVEFGIGLAELVQLGKDGSVEALSRYDGARGLSTRLNTDLEAGINLNNEEIQHRKDTFGSNTYHSRKEKRFWCFLWGARELSHLLVILLAQVFLSLLRNNKKGIFDGCCVEVCIILAILLYIIVRAIIEYKQSLQFAVTRGGRRVLVYSSDIVVGDIVPLRNGGRVPADGLLVANSLRVDEQEITGSGERVQKDPERNPFLLSGSKLIEGIGTMLVTSVGMNTAWGLKMESPLETDEEKPYQGDLKGFAIFASRLVVLTALVACSVQLGRYFSGQTKKSDGTPMFIYGITTADEAKEFVITSLSSWIATIVAAVPFGLSTAVRLILAKTTRKMMTDKLSVQSPYAFERVRSVTTIVCHQTGILTLNEMSVVDVWAGGKRRKDMDNVSQLPTVLKELMIEGIAQNTNGSVFETGVTEPEVYGSPTEQAILRFGNKLGMKFDDARSASVVHHTIPFNPKKKYGGVALQFGTHARVHWKGSAETILSSCESYMDEANNPIGIDDEKRKFFEGTIKKMCKKELRCEALAYQSYDQLESLPTIKEPRNLVLLAIIGIKDPCRPGTRDAIQLCNSGSVKVRMVTGDDVLTAQAIAIECGILTDATDDNIMTGAQFHELTDLEREQKAGNILVLAEASTDDNLLFVKALKNSGHKVAATGMGIHDPEMLREADVSFAMGVEGTAAAKENYDFIVPDNSLATIGECIRESRSLHINVQRYILFRLTVSVSALAICVVEVVVYDAFPLNAMQLLLLNLIIDILGALALAYRPSTGRHLMGKPPVGIRDPLITKAMWSKLIIQAIYLVLSLVLINSEKLLKLKHGHTSNAEKVMNTFVFNCFVFCLVFNEIEIPSVKDIPKENMFLIVITASIISQMIVIEFAGIFTSSTRLDWKKWVLTSLLGLLSQVATRHPWFR